MKAANRSHGRTCTTCSPVCRVRTPTSFALGSKMARNAAVSFARIASNSRCTVARTAFPSAVDGPAASCARSDGLMLTTNANVKMARARRRATARPRCVPGVPVIVSGIRGGLVALRDASGATKIAPGSRVASGRHADDSLEVPREMTLVREARRVHDLRQWESVTDETTRLLDPDLLEVLVRWQAEHRAEHADQVEGAQSGFVGQLSNRDRARVFGFEQVSDAPERRRRPRGWEGSGAAVR